MRIKRISVKNFKSFSKLDINMEDFNVIIGANASGKSNFISIFKFISDMIQYGVNDAISLQGGIKYLCNSKISCKEPIEINFYAVINDNQINRVRKVSFDGKEITPTSLNYTIIIDPHQRGEGYRLSSQKLTVDFSIVEEKKESGKSEEDKKTTNLSVDISKIKNGKITYSYSEPIEEDLKEDLELRYLRRFFRNNDFTLLTMIGMFSFHFRLSDSGMRFYNFNTNLLKSPSSIITKLDLEEDGSNLVNVIQKLIKDKGQKEKLTSLIKSILPFIEEIKTESSVNKSLIFKVKEKYTKNDYPSHLLSDGTVNILALIIALYFQREDEIIVIEEPEKNIHPKLLNNVAQLLKDVSKNKQVIITTHNPYILKEIGLNNVYLISRDREGFSIVTKPADNSKVKTFLENELGLDELFVEGLLYD